MYIFTLLIVYVHKIGLNKASSEKELKTRRDSVKHPTGEHPPFSQNSTKPSSLLCAQNFQAFLLFIKENYH